MVIYAMAGTIFNKNDGVSFAFVYVIASHNFFDNKNKLLMQGKAYTNDFPRFHPPPIPPTTQIPRTVRKKENGLALSQMF